MNKALILIVLLSITLNDIFAAQSLYISPTGNDKNNGTKEQPLASLTGARDQVRKLRAGNLLSAKDTVYIHVMPGKYFMQEPFKLETADGGTAQSPVIFTADPDNRPVFYGGFKTGKFQEVSKNLWRVFIPETAKYGFTFEQMYINGQRRFRAQTPNRGDFFRVKDASHLVGPGALKIKPVPSDAGFLVDASKSDLNDVLTVFYHKWNSTRKRILEINLADSSFFTIGTGGRSIDSTSRYVVENYREALDSPGEWYLSKDGYLYYIPLPGETIDNTECMVPVIDKFIVITGDENKGNNVSHIRFENLRFRVAGYKTPFLGNNLSQSAAQSEATVMIDFADHIEFYNCEIANTGLYGIWFRRNCSRSSVIRCHLHDLGAGGVRIGINIRYEQLQSTDIPSHITVHNNIIQHGGNVFPNAAGVIIFHGSDNVITHNDIANFLYTGVSVGWVWGYPGRNPNPQSDFISPSKRNKIEFNHIHHLGRGWLSDMGGVYLLGPSEGTTVSNNVIHDIFSFDYGGWGLYTDEGSSDILMENNLVYRCSNAGYMHHYGKDNILRNNIFAFNVETQVQFGVVEEHRMFSFLRNIMYYNKGATVNRTWHNQWRSVTATEFDYNSYWNAQSRQTDFNGLDFKEWQKLGKDKNSIIADPLFVDPENFDFRLRRQTVARKIGFKPFDYSNAGVYGDQEWKDKATLPGELKEAFHKSVARNASRGKYSWYESYQK